VTSITANIVQSNSKYQFQNATNLTTLSFPNLTNLGVGGATAIIILTCPAFTTFLAPNLVTVLGEPFTAPIEISDCPLLVSVSLPSLVTIEPAISITVCAALTTLSFPVWVPSNGANSFFSDNALTAASVNHILARHIVNPTWGNAGEVLTLNGGTSAAPSGQGILDKATLIGRGATVVTN
jgi:hypothetical protein